MLVDRPIYLDPAPGAAGQVAGQVSTHVQQLGVAVKPLTMAAGIATMGAVIGYFIPRLLDRWVEARDTRHMRLEEGDEDGQA